MPIRNSIPRKVDRFKDVTVSEAKKIIAKEFPEYKMVPRAKPNLKKLDRSAPADNTRVSR